MKNNLSLFDMFALGFGTIVGVGWSSTLNNLFKLSGGALPAAITFLLATLLFIPVAMSIKSLAIQIPLSGGVSAYALRAFNPQIAFLGGWFITLSYMAILPFEAITATDIFSYIFPVLRSSQPLYTILGEDIYFPAVALGLLCTACIAGINWHGVKAGVRFQKVITKVLLISSATCILFALFKANSSNLLDPVYAPVQGYSHTSFSLGVFSLLSVAPQYFAGFDIIQQNAELSDKRYLGNAILGALLSAGGFYAAVFLATGLSYPWQETAAMSRPVLSNVFLRIYSGRSGKALWCICILATMAGLFGAWNGFFIASIRSMQGMAKAGLLPMAFCKIIGNRDTAVLPFLVSISFTVIGIFLGAGVLDTVCRLASIGFIVAWAISCLSAYRIKKHPALAIQKGDSTRLGTHMAAISVCVLLLFNSIMPFMPGYIGMSGITFLMGWSVLGLLCYAVCHRGTLKIICK